ncbi:MAG: hypothetical protein KF868_18270 [Acidobacteria bacterium]|nr:hypothetical protein [Acidobacteriota bacterium]
MAAIMVDPRITPHDIGTKREITEQTKIDENYRNIQLLRNFCYISNVASSLLLFHALYQSRKDQFGITSGDYNPGADRALSETGLTIIEVRIIVCESATLCQLSRSQNTVNGAIGLMTGDFHRGG